MHAFYKEFIERLTALHREIVIAIDGLSFEALDWTPISIPSDKMNSINILVTHICGAERYWIGDIALGDISDRVRDEEFQIRGMSVEELLNKIDMATEYAMFALEKLNLEDLDTEHTSPRDGRVFTVGWALLHALEHTATHLGHIQITRQMWNEQHRK